MLGILETSKALICAKLQRPIENKFSIQVNTVDVSLIKKITALDLSSLGSELCITLTENIRRKFTI